MKTAYDRWYDLALIGDCSVGKSTLLKSLGCSRVSLLTRKLTVEGTVVQLKIHNVGMTREHFGSSNPQGIVVAGEAPESDEEVGSVSSVSSAASVSSIASLTASAKGIKPANKSKKQDVKYNTLLHKKLRERNVSLHKNFNDLARGAASMASRDLNTINQNLLRSQVQLQEAATALQTLQAHLMHLDNRLAGVTSTGFLPRINVQGL